MKRSLFFALLALTTFVTSCGGGWTDEKKELIKNKCIANAKYDCDCYLDKVVKAFENPDDFNALNQEEKDALVVDCAQAEEIINEEELESF